MADQIVYLVKTEGGGVDGRDPSDKGGKIVAASFQNDESIQRAIQNPRFKLEKHVVDVIEHRAEAIRKLDCLDRLILGL